MAGGATKGKQSFDSIPDNQEQLTEEQTSLAFDEAMKELKEDGIDAGNDFWNADVKEREKTDLFKKKKKEEDQEEENTEDEGQEEEDEEGNEEEEESESEDESGEEENADDDDTDAEEDDEESADGDGFELPDAREYAEEHDISFEDAKSELSSISKQLKKYEGDPFKIAKSLVSAIRTASKGEEKIKELQERGPDKVYLKDGEQLIGNVVVSKDDLINKYKEAYPDKAETKTDDEIYEIANEIMHEKIQLAQEKLAKDVEDKATAKKNEFLESLDDFDRKKIDTISGILKEMHPQQILHPDFMFEDVLHLARGKTAKEDIEQARKEGYEAGLNKRKIRKGKSNLPPKSSKSSGKNTHGLTPAQQEKAKKMYAKYNISDEEAFKNFAEQGDDEDLI